MGTWHKLFAYFEEHWVHTIIYGDTCLKSGQLKPPGGQVEHKVY